MTGRHHAGDTALWHVDGFLPAPAGSWQIVALDEHGTVTYQQLPGWLVEEEVTYDIATGLPLTESFQPCRPFRRVVAAAHVHGELVAVYEAVWGFWKVISTAAPRPTPEQVKRELEHRDQLRAATEKAAAR